jgi:hypothetical protein
MTILITPSGNYQTQSDDTAIASEIILFNLWRSQSLLQRIINLNHNTYSARCTAWYIAKTTLANQNQRQQIGYFLKKVLDTNWIDCVEIQGELQMTGAIEEALIVAEILESLDIPYLVGGSLASGIWGEMRYTQDIDLVVDIKESQIKLLLNAFSARFYISEIAVREAVKLGQSFHLIDHQTGWKIDMFLLTKDPFQQLRFQQKTQVLVNEMGQNLSFSSAEDTILQKLIWYEMTQKNSSQQWRDILGIFKLQQSALNLDYLQQWANILQLSTALEKAIKESQLNG